MVKNKISREKSAAQLVDAWQCHQYISATQKLCVLELLIMWASRGECGDSGYWDSKINNITGGN